MNTQILLKTATNTLFDNALSFTEELVAFESVTPDDAGCAKWLAEKLEQKGAEVEILQQNGVTNLLASIGLGYGPNVAFCGHIDVVPAGNLSKWIRPPFRAIRSDDKLYGRGVADMKGGVAAALAATHALLQEYGQFNGRLWFLITSDEEGEAEYGSKLIVDLLSKRDVKLDYCVIGEPTAINHTGDMLKVGRRGALSFDVSLCGRSAHVAYPSQGTNAIHIASTVIEKLKSITWDSGSDDFPGTSLQITHIDSGKWTDNVIPDKVSLSFNIRYSAQYRETELIKMVNQIVSEVTSDFTLSSYRNCDPYLSSCSEGRLSLIKEVETVIHQQLGLFPRVSTSGGTSDGRFFKDICPQIVELGLPNKTIHQENEHVTTKDICVLAEIYKALFQRLLEEEPRAD
ncbi:succinyl-diaminopimelate desuccinylase [Rheinheimera aquimaris]|jgi:succinyl-diaminopimelate desuccinylase|uniref:succinyl-diaminopimelate desuccinylase n=1 Tax=Rheinheimera aquimaris TaxID=412437 RepID=UPI001065FB8E|nr:succinyl-diaminopimelate desuccinylase [Rheinheimera aquimaris]